MTELSMRYKADDGTPCACEWHDGALVNACLTHWRFFYRTVDDGRAPTREQVSDRAVIVNLFDEEAGSQ